MSKGLDFEIVVLKYDMHQDLYVSLATAYGAAIENGGGTGYLTSPGKMKLITYFNNRVKDPGVDVFIARKTGTNEVLGSVQLVHPSAKSEAAQHRADVSTLFVSPYARGNGVAQALMNHLIGTAWLKGYLCVDLDVRETQKSAIGLYQSLGFEQWGVHPKYVHIDGQYASGLYMSLTR